MSISRYRMILSTALNMRSVKIGNSAGHPHGSGGDPRCDGSCDKGEGKKRNFHSRSGAFLPRFPYDQRVGEKEADFDLEIPYSYKKKDCDRVIGQIGALMKEMDEKYECVVNIDKNTWRESDNGRVEPSNPFQNVPKVSF